MQDAVSATRPSGRIEAIFGSWEFFKLWIAQIISATGDWLGLIAIISLAGRINDGSEGTAIALVLGARIAPGFFLATAAGLIVDRLDRSPDPIEIIVLDKFGSVGAQPARHVAEASSRHGGRRNVSG